MRSPVRLRSSHWQHPAYGTDPCPHPAGRCRSLGQAERLVKVVKPIHADALGNLHHRYVAGIHQGFGQRLHAVAACVCTLDLPVLHLQGATAVVGVLGMSSTQIIRGGDRHQLGRWSPARSYPR